MICLLDFLDDALLFVYNRWFGKLHCVVMLRSIHVLFDLLMKDHGKHVYKVVQSRFDEPPRSLLLFFFLGVSISLCCLG